MGDVIDGKLNLVTGRIGGIEGRIQGFESKFEIIESMIAHLPTKDEFYAEMLKLYKKQDDLEIEKDALVSRTTDNSSRIDSLEKIHPDGKHQTL